MPTDSPLDRGVAQDWLTDRMTVRHPLRYWGIWVAWAVVLNGAGVVLALYAHTPPPAEQPTVEFAAAELTARAESGDPPVLRIPLRLSHPPESAVEVYWRAGDGPRRTATVAAGAGDPALEIAAADLPGPGERLEMRLEGVRGGRPGKRVVSVIVIEKRDVGAPGGGGTPPPPVEVVVVQFKERAVVVAAGQKFTGAKLDVEADKPLADRVVNYSVKRVGDAAVKGGSLALAPAAAIPPEAIPDPKTGETYELTLLGSGVVRVGEKNSLTVTFGSPARAEVRVAAGKDRTLDRVKGDKRVIDLTRERSTARLSVVFYIDSGVKEGAFEVTTGDGVTFDPTTQRGEVEFNEKQAAAKVTVKAVAPPAGQELADDVPLKVQFQPPVGHDLKGEPEGKVAFALQCPGRDGDVLVLVMATGEVLTDEKFRADVTKQLTRLADHKDHGREKWVGKAVWLVAADKADRPVVWRSADAKGVRLPNDGHAADHKDVKLFSDAIGLGIDARSRLLVQLAPDRGPKVRTVLVWPSHTPPESVDHWNPAAGAAAPRAAKFPADAFVASVFLGLNEKQRDEDPVLLKTYGVNNGPDLAFTTRVKAAAPDVDGDLAVAIENCLSASK